MKPLKNKWLKLLGSLEVSLIGLLLLFILVFVCTLDQVNLGTFAATDKYFRALFLYKTLPVVGWKIPVFPAGGLVGILMLVSLIGTLLTRVQYTRRKTGIWLIHAGMVLLVLGEFVTGMFAVESNLTFEEGQTVNYTEASRRSELVVVDHSNPGYDEVVSFSGASLGTGRRLRHERLPFELSIRTYFSNSAVGDRPPGGGLPDSLADRGLGRNLVVQPLDAESRDDRRAMPAAFVEVHEGGRMLGTWLVSSGITLAQDFQIGGKRYSIAMRPYRYYLPFSMTLKDFSHDRYAGTEIAKNFSSLVRLLDPVKSEDRDVLIYMNHPLRHAGRTFYQSSFGKNDTLSVLQVVVNPAWQLPYISCTLIGLGLLIQFLVHLVGFKPVTLDEAVGRPSTASGGGTSSHKGSVGGRK